MNKYVLEAVAILEEALKWIKYIFLTITVFKVAQYSFEYQKGDADEKSHAVKLIRKSLSMGGGFFFLIWFAQYVASRFANL